MKLQQLIARAAKQRFGVEDTGSGTKKTFKYVSSDLGYYRTKKGLCCAIFKPMNSTFSFCADGIVEVHDTQTQGNIYKGFEFRSVAQMDSKATAAMKKYHSATGSRSSKRKRTAGSTSSTPTCDVRTAISNAAAVMELKVEFVTRDVDLRSLKHCKKGQKKWEQRRAAREEEKAERRAKRAKATLVSPLV